MLAPLFGLSLLAAHQDGFDGMPKFHYRPAIMAGQREIVLGPMLQYDTQMQISFDKYVPAVIGDHSVDPAQSANYSEGYIRWSVKDDKLFNSPCRVLKMACLTRGVNLTKRQRIEYSSTNTTSWWITPEGKLLRESVKLTDPDQTRTAECVYWSDHIEVSVVTPKERKAFTVFPNVDLSMVDAQFKPMIVDNKVVLREKEYLVYDPFKQAFKKYKATVGGKFSGVYMAAKFDGTHVDIEGPDREREVVCVSNEGDLVKVDLSDTETIVLTNLPHSKDPMYKKLGGES